MGATFGKDCILYRCATLLDGLTGSAGLNTPDLATWVECDNVIDLDENFGAEKVDTTTRATAKTGWGTEEVVLQSGEISFGVQQPDDPTADAFLTALIAAWNTKALIALMPLSGPIATAGHVGLAANYSIEMTRTQPLKDRVVWQVTATPAEFPELFTSPQS